MFADTDSFRRQIARLDMFLQRRPPEQRLYRDGMRAPNLARSPDMAFREVW
ncbi:hypothetical protein R3X27_06725 [Tropicimonas sp. TH_r6]|uniref:hypothetical protein n=1 Tax=Tropicimonas sp. TH_r6 TaxID=3082085 RepID=UPI0029552A51|nr:hypothetical protein [Tropicimonas sp. TH_r6]MDV7142372.1 hypothetical protein [Tropicimonas sp. TH_r6]